LIALIVGLYLIVIKPSWASVCVYGLLAASVLLTSATSRGLPISIKWAEMLREFPERPKIAGFVLKEGSEIDILLTTGLNISLPWSETTAAELHDQAAAAQASGSQLAMQEEGNPRNGTDAKRRGTGTKGFGFNPFGSASFGFYADPQPALPDKQGE
jgi:hypothetical protein